jgi:hypothetical protein
VPLGLLAQLDLHATAEQQLIADVPGPFGDDEARVEVRRPRAVRQLLGRHRPQRLVTFRAGNGEIRLGLGRAQRRAAVAMDVDHRSDPSPTRARPDQPRATNMTGQSLPNSAGNSPVFAPGPAECGTADERR